MANFTIVSICLEKMFQSHHFLHDIWVQLIIQVDEPLSKQSGWTTILHFHLDKMFRHLVGHSPYASWNMSFPKLSNYDPPRGQAHSTEDCTGDQETEGEHLSIALADADALAEALTEAAWAWAVAWAFVNGDSWDVTQRRNALKGCGFTYTNEPKKIHLTWVVCDLR